MPRMKDDTKVSLTIRLDRRILDFFKAQGDGYQTRINDALVQYVNKLKGNGDGRKD